MKKKNLSSLILRKSSISSLNFVTTIRGKGPGQGEGSVELCGETYETYCETCATCDTTCDTKNGCDTTRTLGDNSFGEACNGFNTGVGC